MISSTLTTHINFETFYDFNDIYYVNFESHFNDFNSTYYTNFQNHF